MEHRPHTTDFDVPAECDGEGNQCIEQSSPDVAHGKLLEKEQMEPVNCTSLELSIYLQELAAGYLATSCSDTNASAPSKSITIASKSWRHARKTGTFPGFQFSMTLNRSTEISGEGSSMLSREVSLVRTSALRAPSWALMASEADSGRSSSGLWAKFDPASCSLRTAQHSLLEDSIACSPTLPPSGLMLAGRVYQRPSLAPVTNVTAPGSLPTPLKSWGRRGPGLSNNLDNLRCSLGVTKECLAIVEAVGWRWPASFVEWMMGWPSQWSALKPLEMDKFQSWRQRRSNNSQDKEAA
jgi:hypothetical protein